MGFMTGQKIYENFRDGAGPRGLSDSAGMVRDLAAEYREEGEAIRRLVARMESVWQGAAAGAAQRGAGPLATEHEQAAPPMDTAQDLNGRQAGSFTHARNSVVPVPPRPVAPDPWAMFHSPGPALTYRQQVLDHHLANQHNVDVMTGYAKASAYNTEGMPRSYGSIVTDRATVAVAPGESNPGTPGAADDLPHRRDGVGEPPATSVPAPVSSGPTASGDTGGPAGPGRALPPQRTTPGGFAPGTVSSGAGSSGPGDAPGPGQAGGGSRIVLPVGRDTGSGTPGSDVPRGGFPGPGSRVPPPPARAGGNGRPGAGGPAPGRAGAPTGGALPVAAGGRGRTAADIERYAPEFLWEQDPEAVFGTDEPTAPPVVGADHPAGTEPAGTG